LSNTRKSINKIINFKSDRLEFNNKHPFISFFETNENGDFLYLANEIFSKYNGGVRGMYAVGG